MKLYESVNVVTGAWMRLHRDRLHDFYSLSNILWVIKIRIMRWAGHVARMEKGRGALRVCVET